MVLYSRPQQYYEHNPGWFPWKQKEKNSQPTNCICQLQWRIQGRGLGPPPPPPPSHHLFLDQTEAQRAEKIFFLGGGLRPPPLISRSGSGTELEILVIALLHCTFLLPVVSIQVYLAEV